MGPKTLTPTSVCGLPRYLKYIPVSRPTQLTASAKAINRNQPATVLPLRWTSDVVVMAAIVPDVAASYYRASLTVLPPVRGGAAPGRRPVRLLRTAPRPRSPNPVGPVRERRAG